MKSFSVRSRTLAALCSGLVATSANIFWGWFFDRKSLSRPKMAKITWFFFAISMLGLLGWQTSNEKLYETTQPTLDWASPGFGRGFASMMLFRLVYHSRRSINNAGQAISPHHLRQIID